MDLMGTVDYINMPGAQGILSVWGPRLAFSSPYQALLG